MWRERAKPLLVGDGRDGRDPVRLTRLLIALGLGRRRLTLGVLVVRGQGAKVGFEIEALRTLGSRLRRHAGYEMHDLGRQCRAMFLPGYGRRCEGSFTRGAKECSPRS